MKPVLLNFPHAFETERLYIRCPQPGDGAEINAAIVESQAELKPWMPFADPLPSVEETEEHVRRSHVRFLLREDLPMQMYLRESRQFVGNTGFHRINWDIGRFEIGYWVRTSETGKGFMTEAVAGMVAFAAEHLHAQRLEIRCDPRNTRSSRVAERAGFHLEGILLRDDPDVSGQPSSTAIYAKLLLDDGIWGYPQH